MKAIKMIFNIKIIFNKADNYLIYIIIRNKVYFKDLIIFNKN